ncbi:C4-dicarboxylate ABC transporter substrate-binding protein [Allostella sp. ATCC 35155]|nr:C4-dicarboxylate ABC transporter substrate-binding protein [Stella sp. ATCC 35155]
MMTHRLGRAVAALFAFTLAGTAASAQTLPARDLTYIIPFNPGGESDVTARLQEPVYRRLTGHGFVIQYKTGGGGAAAWAQLNGLPTDGGTMMGFNTPHIFLQPMSGKAGYRTADINPVYIFQLTPHALIVAADSPIKSIEEYVAAAKAKPGAITVAGTGTHSANHVAQQSFDQAAGIRTTYVPFTGTGATVTALLGKQVAALWNFTTVGVEQKGKVRVLAVAMEQRHPQFPDVPTFREKGVDMVDGAMRGVAVPAGTPDPVRRQLSETFRQINADPAFRQKMIDGGYVPLDVGQDKLPAFMAEHTRRYAEIGKLLGLVK